MRIEQRSREMQDAERRLEADSRVSITEARAYGALEGLQALWGDLQERPLSVIWQGVRDVREQWGGLWDSLRDGVAEAVADIRKKVFEEGFYGREVTPKEMEVTHHDHRPASPESAVKPPGFEDLMRTRGMCQPEAANDPGRPTPETPHPDIDR
ncbi:MAG: hypothetical protein BGO51_24400 [Rhodospirillales bacterium 69-11]|jgi:hypothetical protein|nr:MAG: hypothetical protein BGO51_24400 [Rhodospirillales bacterium 69-11]